MKLFILYKITKGYKIIILDKNMKNERYKIIDIIRGIALINMILYHGMYDIVNIYNINVGWFNKTPGYIWQQGICWTFIIVAGMSWKLSSNHIKRGLIISFYGLVITVVTLLVMPEERVLFGILTFIGVSTLLMIPLDKLLLRCKAQYGILISGLFFFICRNVNVQSLGFENIIIANVPEKFYRSNIFAVFGFPRADFYSSDYFSIIPWFFLYLIGYFLCDVLINSGIISKLSKINNEFLEFMGRKSLIIYMLHQVVLILILQAIFFVLFKNTHYEF